MNEGRENTNAAIWIFICVALMILFASWIMKDLPPQIQSICSIVTCVFAVGTFIVVGMFMRSNGNGNGGGK